MSLLVKNHSRTNSQRFALYIILVQDNYGTGRPVGFAFLRREDKPSVRWSLKRFIEAMGPIDSTKVAFVDKDFSEISAINELLPSVDILLCQFHVMKHVKKAISQLAVNVEEKLHFLSLFKAVLHAGSQVKTFVGLVFK